MNNERIEVEAALRLALDLLRKKEWEACDYAANANEAADILEKALAQTEQEPVAWALTEELEKGVTTTSAHLWFTDPQNSSWTAIYTTPPTQCNCSQRPSRSDMTWVGLTDEEISVIAFNSGDEESAIHAAMDLLKEKNQ